MIKAAVEELKGGVTTAPTSTASILDCLINCVLLNMASIWVSSLVIQIVALLDVRFKLFIASLVCCTCENFLVVVKQPSSCQEVKSQRLGDSDGTYSILTGSGGVLEIYCHGMKTAYPKEFVTLSQSADNYAEIFPVTWVKTDVFLAQLCSYSGWCFSLRHPSTCPTDLSPPAVNNRHYPGKGRSTFSRVRIDVLSMELIGNLISLHFMSTNYTECTAFYEWSCSQWFHVCNQRRCNRTCYWVWLGRWLLQ